MTSVAAIREKFLQRDAPNRFSSPSPTISSNGISPSKSESKDKSSLQKSLSSSVDAKTNSNKFQKNSFLPFGHPNRNVSRATQAKILTPSPKTAHNTKTTSSTELGRSSSLTDLVVSDSDKQHKRLNSIGSLSNSSDLGNLEAEKICIVSELKSRFERNASTSSLPKKPFSDKHNVSKSEASEKPPVLKLKPNSLILSLNSNHGETASNKDDGQKVTGIDKGSSTASSSTSVISCAKARQDLSAISTSNSNSKNTLINEGNESDPNQPSSEEIQSDDTSLAADKMEGLSRVKLCRLKRLLGPHELGPPPAKPSKPSFLKSPCVKLLPNVKLFSLYEKHASAGFNLLQPPKRPPPKPPNDTSGKPLPPLPINEDIYDDNQNEENLTLTELTEQQEKDIKSNSCSRPASNIVSNDELYHDIESEKELEKDDIYETMEIDPCATDLNKEYSEKSDYKDVFDDMMQRWDSKDNKKKETEMAKIRDKFKLTGDEMSLGTGSVKRTVRSRGSDLSVKEGEKVTIYRMENNPSGKWLVINEKGKVGYVELSNIQIDPESVKNVMHTSYKNLQYFRSSKHYLYDDDDDIYQEIDFQEDIW